MQELLCCMYDIGHGQDGPLTMDYSLWYFADLGAFELCEFELFIIM